MISDFVPQSFPLLQLAKPGKMSLLDGPDSFFFPSVSCTTFFFFAFLKETSSLNAEFNSTIFPSPKSPKLSSNSISSKSSSFLMYLISSAMLSLFSKGARLLLSTESLVMRSSASCFFCFPSSFSSLTTLLLTSYFLQGLMWVLKTVKLSIQRILEGILPKFQICFLLEMPFSKIVFLLPFSLPNMKSTNSSRSLIFSFASLPNSLISCFTMYWAFMSSLLMWVRSRKSLNCDFFSSVLNSYLLGYWLGETKTMAWFNPVKVSILSLHFKILSLSALILSFWSLHFFMCRSEIVPVVLARVWKLKMIWSRASCSWMSQTGRLRLLGVMALWAHSYIKLKIKWEIGEGVIDIIWEYWGKGDRGKGSAVFKKWGAVGRENENIP